MAALLHFVDAFPGSVGQSDRGIAVFDAGGEHERLHGLPLSCNRHAVTTTARRRDGTTTQ
jgi:hypothetical protein